jgi:hypothetical protein
MIFMGHNYSSYGFAYVNGRPDLHLKRDEEQDLQVINVDSFVSEVEQAAQKYVEDLRYNGALLEKFVQRITVDGNALLGPVSIRTVGLKSETETYPPATGGP